MHVAEMQRSRLLAAAVAAISELGYSRASVAHITARARVSRRTFYDLFADREDCLLAVLEDAVQRIEGEIAETVPAGCGWRERVRGGLFAILSFFDREPGLARVCVVQSARGGQLVLEAREEILARLAGILDEGRHERARSAEMPSLTAEGLAGAGLTILYKRLLMREPEPLRGLLGELMSMIVLPYLGPAAARRELTSRAPAPVTTVPSRARRDARVPHEDPLRGIPLRLTYRTARVLDEIAERQGASNRMVAELAEVSDQGQISKLLARLGRLGLICNTGQGQSHGEPNAWRLTSLGEEVQQAIHASVVRRSAVAVFRGKTNGEERRRGEV
jgi:AcrR family transcriptional regulator/DNA-binding MarR family transcriptional regulator